MMQKLDKIDVALDSCSGDNDNNDDIVKTVRDAMKKFQ